MTRSATPYDTLEAAPPSPVAPTGSPSRIGLAGVMSVVGLLTVGLLGWRVSGGSPPGLDRAMEGWVLSHRSPTLSLVFAAITRAGSSVVVLPLVVALAWACWRVVGPRLAGLVVLVQIGNVAATQLLKALTARMRPSTAPLVDAAGAAFPSGHASNSALLFGGTAILLTALIGVRRRRLVTPLQVGLVAIAALVGISRLYLDVHWTTDIIAGWALGASWLPLLWLASRFIGTPPGENPPQDEQLTTTSEPHIQAAPAEASPAGPTGRGTRWEHILLARHDVR